MSSPFVAEIRIWACNFAPTGWAQCNGQLLPISQNTALFSLLGTFYGGDGKSTFALPNLEGSVPIHVGGSQPGPGLSNYSLGQQGGSETVTLLQSEIPAHGHSLNASKSDATDRVPTGKLPANGLGGIVAYAAPGALTQFSPNALGPTGGDLPHNNLMPYLVLNFCIALQGVFPPRS
jgi:microcystin-dependent protein